MVVLCGTGIAAARDRWNLCRRFTICILAVSTEAPLTLHCTVFLGPRGPLVLPLKTRPSELKIWITYIQAYMPYESSEVSSMVSGSPLSCPLSCPVSNGKRGLFLLIQSLIIEQNIDRIRLYLLDLQ